MKNFLYLIIAVTALIAGCENNADTSNVKIRLSNASDLDFKNTIVNPGSESVDFGNINANEYSDYKTFSKAYRYGFIQLEIDGDTLTLQPRDYMGESPLKNGHYTYELNVSGVQGHYSLSLEFKVD